AGLFLCQLLLAKFNKLKHQGLEITFMLRTVSVHTGDADRTLCSYQSKTPDKFAHFLTMRRTSCQDRG
ncbi:hypothetical protein, partial [Klebsiella pneumoniae]|uniref:hypothetical protein n=1 Tax=Klebsiella pneumoniae TaxID=573 RepID=UPI002F963785